MKINKQSCSERSNESTSTQKNGCGCTHKDNIKESEEEIEVKISK